MWEKNENKQKEAEFGSFKKGELTVTRIPIMTPTTGLDRSSDWEKNPERLRPPRMRNELLKKVNEQTNM